MREVVGEFGLLSVRTFRTQLRFDTPLFPSWHYSDHGVYVFATEARGLTVIVELRRYNRSKKFQNCVAISGFVVISDYFRIYCHSGPNFWSSFRRYIRFVVITDVVINDFYCIYIDRYIHIHIPGIQANTTQ